MFLPHELYGSYELGVFVKIVMAALAGALVGLEREKHGRPAGLRTHLLVAVGACLMVVVSEGFHLKYSELNGLETPLRVDPGRVAAQIVSGIGFLGAGVIIKEGLSVRGLTTAASLWLVAGLGMAFGVGLIAPGLLATAVALFCLITLKRLEPTLKKDRYLHLKVIARTDPDIYPELTELLTRRKLRITDLSSTIDLENRTVIYQFNVVQHRKVVGREITALIAQLPGVKRISFQGGVGSWELGVGSWEPSPPLAKGDLGGFASSCPHGNPPYPPFSKGGNTLRMIGTTLRFRTSVEKLL